MMNKVPLTVKGAELLRSELHQLKTVERPKVIASIQEARSHGDLSENAEYDAAKERQSFIEGRIVEVESKLANAQIIDPAHLDADGRCVFGATVDLEEVDSRETVTYQIVGDDEADIKNNKISISSPIARRIDWQIFRRYRRGQGSRRHQGVRDSGCEVPVGRGEKRII
jgi:transcription elongation factor GreA